MTFKTQLLIGTGAFILFLSLTLFQSPFLMKLTGVQDGMTRDQVVELIGEPDSVSTNENDLDPTKLTGPAHIERHDFYGVKCMPFVFTVFDFYYFDGKLVSHKAYNNQEDYAPPK